MAIKKVLVTGGAGYVGTVLVPILIRKGYQVTVIDWYIFGKNYFSKWKNDPHLREINGDIRNRKLMEKAIKGIDAVIHLACNASDLSFDLNPKFSISVNYDATKLIYNLSKKMGIKRFIYASSSAVYGVKKEREVTEQLSLEPITPYAKYKALCEKYLLAERDNSMPVTIVRPAAICGYSPRLRLDLSVNTLTIHALVNHKMTVYGGEQQRSQIHVKDISDFYLKLLDYPENKINSQIYNVTCGNFKIIEIARLISTTLIDQDISLEVIPQNDNRSYHISGKKAREELGFIPKFSVADAITDVKNAYESGLIKKPLSNPRFYNHKVIASQIGKLNLTKYEI